MWRVIIHCGQDTDGYIYIVDITSKEHYKLEQNIHPGVHICLGGGKMGAGWIYILSWKMWRSGVWGIYDHDNSLLFHFTLPGIRLIISLLQFPS